MSIERQYGRIMLICDECEEDYTQYKSDEFSYMIQAAKHDGWLITKEKGTDEYTHLCPDCADKLPKVS